MFEFEEALERGPPMKELPTGNGVFQGVSYCSFLFLGIFFSFSFLFLDIKKESRTRGRMALNQFTPLL